MNRCHEQGLPGVGVKRDRPRFDPAGVVTPVAPVGVGVKKYFRGHDPAGVGVEKKNRGHDPAGAGVKNIFRGHDPAGAGVKNIFRDRDPAGVGVKTYCRGHDPAGSGPDPGKTFQNIRVIINEDSGFPRGRGQTGSTLV